MHESSEVVFWSLIEEHHNTLWRFSLGLTRSREDALDLVNDTIVAAHAGFERLRDRQAFLKSLYTIAYRTHKRKLWRRRLFVNTEECRDIGYEPGTESEYDLELLLRALATLPEKQRQAVLLFEISGFNIEEIRELQGGTVSGVKSRLKRARTALHTKLREKNRSDNHRDTLSQSLPVPQFKLIKL